MTALIDTLFQLEKQLGIELDSLMPYAEADNIGGYHPDPTQRKWGAGAIWDVEGRTLYALIRALHPNVVVEIGSGTGCSTTHMAAALKANAGTRWQTLGHITTIDRGNTPQVPDELQVYVTITNDDAINYLALLPDNSIDFLLEDADHSIQLCQAIGELAKTKLKPGGVLISHDAAHPGVGADVKRGYDLAGLDFRVYLTDPSDCGWAVWKRPALSIDEKLHAPIIHIEPEYHDLMRRVMQDNEEADGSPVNIIDEVLTQARQDFVATVDAALNNQPVLQAQEEPNAPPVEKPKRTPKPSSGRKPKAR